MSIHNKIFLCDKPKLAINKDDVTTGDHRDKCAKYDCLAQQMHSEARIAKTQFSHFYCAISRFCSIRQSRSAITNSVK